MKSWFQFMIGKGKNHFVGNLLFAIPLFGLFACIPQQNPQLDSLQEQISALRTDIEEVQESRRDIRRLGADIGQLSDKLDESALNPTRRVEETSRLLLQNIVDSRIQMKELVDEISAIKENFNEHSQVIRDISIQTKTLESNLIKQILKLQAKMDKSIKNSKSSLIPAILYLKAESLSALEKKPEAKEVFQHLITDYPLSEEAIRAKPRLDLLP